MQKLINPRVSVGNSSFVFGVSSQKSSSRTNHMRFNNKHTLEVSKPVSERNISGNPQQAMHNNVVIILKSHKL